MKHKYTTILLILFLVSYTVTVNAATFEDFIPNNSVLYVEFKGLGDAATSIKTGEISAILNTLGATKIIDTLGNHSCLAIWLDKKDRINAGFVVDTEGDMVDIQRLKKIATRLIGLISSTIKEDVGKHRKVRYGELDMDENKILFGYVDEYFVIGIGEYSFKTIIDTYQNKLPSLLTNDRYVAASKKIGPGEISVYCDVEGLATVENQDKLEPFKKVIEKLDLFKILSATLNLREHGNFLKVYATLTPTVLKNLNDQIKITQQISDNLDPLKTIRAMTGKEKLFVAISPVITHVLWNLLQVYINTEAEGDFYDFINLIEGEYNIDFFDDVIPALTGELALSVTEFQPFMPGILEERKIDFNISVSTNAEGSSEIEAKPFDLFGFIFSSSNQRKWDEFSNALANKDNVGSIQFFDYNGIRVSEIANRVYLCNSDGLAITSVGEDEIYSLIDSLQAEKHFPVDIEQILQTSIVCLQLNLVTLIEALFGTDHIPDANEVLPMLTWLSVEDNSLKLQAAFLNEDVPIDTLSVFLITTVKSIMSSRNKPNNE